MESNRWNVTPILNMFINVLLENKGEMPDKRMEELLKKDFPYINSLLLDEIIFKLEIMNIINVFRVSKNKKMIVYNKNNNSISQDLLRKF